jgi:hypothetical protein
MRKYAVDTSQDDPDALRDCLHRVAEAGGRIISVTWQPNRPAQQGSKVANLASGYTIVSEHE